MRTLHGAVVVVWQYCVSGSEPGPGYRIERLETNLGYPGNRRCWDDDYFVYETCCNTSLSPIGNSGSQRILGCWDNNINFDVCCFAKGHALARPGNLECWKEDASYNWDRCCDPDVFSIEGKGNGACWNGPYTYEMCCFRDAASEMKNEVLKVDASCSSNSAGVDEFLKSAHEVNSTVTDKVTGATLYPGFGHHYHVMYGIYLKPLRDVPIKLFEIGLGCTMALKKN